MIEEKIRQVICNNASLKLDLEIFAETIREKENKGMPIKDYFLVNSCHIRKRYELSLTEFLDAYDNFKK